MKIKDNKLIISIPDGMEIDLENSDLKNGIIKYMKKRITYKDVYDKLNILCRNIAVTPNNIQKLIAIDKLLDIARYYNGDWKPNWKDRSQKYYIYFDNYVDKYGIESNEVFCRGSVYFKNREDAQLVINNPNFRGILDAIYKN